MRILENCSFGSKSCKKVLKSSRKDQLFVKVIFDIFEGMHLFEENFRMISGNPSQKRTNREACFKE